MTNDQQPAPALRIRGAEPAPGSAPLKERVREAFNGSLVWLVRWGTRAGGLYVGFRLLALVITLLAGDPRAIREGADAGARALTYIRKAMAAGYLPSDDTPTGQLPPKPSPAPSSSPSPSPTASPAKGSK